MWGVVKGFQIACNLAGQLRDLTGRGDLQSGKLVHKDLAEPLGDLNARGDQTSGKVVHKDLVEPLGDLTGRGDQPSLEVVLVTGAVHVKETAIMEPEQQEEVAQGCSQVGQNGYR